MNGITIGNMQFHFHNSWFDSIELILICGHNTNRNDLDEVTIHYTTFSVLILAFANVIIKFRRRQPTGTTDNGRRNKSKHRFSHTEKMAQNSISYSRQPVAMYVCVVLVCPSAVSAEREQKILYLYYKRMQIRTLFLAFAIHNLLFFSIRRESQTHTPTSHTDTRSFGSPKHSSLIFFLFVERDDSSERDCGERERESTRRYFCA